MSFDRDRRNDSPEAEARSHTPYATSEQVDGFMQQSLGELGVPPSQRKTSSFRQQSLAGIDQFIQRRANHAPTTDDAVDAARAGVAGPGQALPHADRIQASFGHHDISNVRAHVAGDAEAASAALGARAYATGDQVAFASQPDLHTAAHEAAHVVQQREGAVRSKGVGAADDVLERQADEVADAVVAGHSAGPLLDQQLAGTAGPTADSGAVQRKPAADAGFVPELQTDDKKAQMYLGQTYPHRVRVTNESAAPEGTEYAWSHSVRGPSHRPVGEPERAGPESSYPFALRGVGNYVVSSRLRYGPSSGPKNETQTAVEVIVGKVTKHDVNTETEKDGKRRPFAGNMLVGEDLVITTQLHELRRADGEPLEDVRAHVMIPGLDFKGVKTLANGIYEIRLHAPREGGAVGVVAALPFDTKLGDTPVHSIRADISKADGEKNLDARPVDFQAAKDWLRDDYDHLFREMHAGSEALNKQTQVSDPPPRQSVWVELLLGCATAALGGAAAGISLAVSKHLMAGAGEVMEETFKSFMEQSLVAAATTSFQKEEIGHNAPHVSFYRLQKSALNKKQSDFEKFHLVNVIGPKLDAMEQRELGAGFREAMAIDRALNAEIPNVQRLQYQESFEQWVKFVTKAQLGERSNPKDEQGETGTDMTNEVSRETGSGKLPSTAGVINIHLGGTNVFDPKTPVTIEKATMPGFNAGLRSEITKYKVKDIPFALRVEGSAPGRYDGAYAFARNENGEYWISRRDHAYLEKKAGGTALEGAMKILEQEVGDEHVTPER